MRHMCLGFLDSHARRVEIGYIPPPMLMHDASGSDASVLSLDRVRVEFGALAAVRDVSFSLRGGDLLGLIGPNGTGKTTLLRAVAGLQPMAAGRVRVVGLEMGPGEADALRQVGFTPDTPPFYDALTVRDYLRFIGKGYELSPAEVEERIDFWLEKVWLSEKGGQKVKALSRGMR